MLLRRNIYKLKLECCECMYFEWQLNGMKAFRATPSACLVSGLNKHARQAGHICSYISILLIWYCISNFEARKLNGFCCESIIHEISSLEVLKCWVLAETLYKQLWPWHTNAKILKLIIDLVSITSSKYTNYTDKDSVVDYVRCT